MEGSSGWTTVDAEFGCGVVGSRGVVCVGLIEDVDGVGWLEGTGGLVIGVDAVGAGRERGGAAGVVLDVMEEELGSG